MKERKVTYFEEPGEKNSEQVLEAALERLGEKDVKHVVVSTHRGLTVLKAAEKFKGLDLNIVAVTVPASTKPEVLKEWNENLPKMEKLGIKTHRGTSSLSGTERGIRLRWGGVGPTMLIADTLRTLGEGTKVCVEILLMATDAGLVPAREKALVIAGTSRGADTCLVLKSTFSSKFFELAIQEVVCKPYSDGVKHEAR